MSSNPIATVVICTRNRSASLGRTLDSIVAAAAKETRSWELLIVDNGSTDDTPAVIEGYADRLPIRRVAQPIAGLSNARNAGVAESRGDFVLWTDDDVVVHEDWLRAWLQAFVDHPEAVVLGGRTEPVYEAPEQPWFRANEAQLGSLLAIRDVPEWTAVTQDRVPYGLNYAVRGREQRTHLYDPELGVAPGRRRGGEEVAVMRALLAEGGAGRWVWDATVYHMIPAERQTAAYIRTFYEANGFDFPIAGPQRRARARIGAIVRSAWALVKADLAYRRAWRSDPAAAVAPLIASARARGSLKRHLGFSN